MTAILLSNPLKIFFLVIMGWLLSCTTATFASAGEETTKAPLLITAYGPFDNRGKNGSSTLLRALQKENQLPQVTYRELPVTWEAVDELFAGYKSPTALRGIIGIGEGYPGRVSIEICGRNNNDGPDVLGKRPSKPMINAVGPTTNKSRLRYTLPNENEGGVKVIVSDDAGNYLCNYLLYKANATAFPVSGFIHVPPQGDMDDDAYIKRYLPIVRAILLENCAVDKPSP